MKSKQKKEIRTETRMLNLIPHVSDATGNIHQKTCSTGTHFADSTAQLFLLQVTYSCQYNNLHKRLNQDLRFRGVNETCKETSIKIQS